MTSSGATADQHRERTPVRYLVIPASMRRDSLNARLARLAAKRIHERGGEALLVEMKEFDSPSFDQDVQDTRGIPAGADRLRQLLETHDAFVIASPEYNFSVPGHLKNVIDWVSRFRPQPFNERHALLMSASPAMAGGNRGLWALRVPLEHLGTRVFPDMFSLAIAHQAFTAEGELADPTLSKRFEKNIAAFMDLVEASTNYPCIKKAWVEFLGERADAMIDRVEE